MDSSSMLEERRISAAELCARGDGILKDVDLGYAFAAFSVWPRVSGAVAP